MRKGDISIAKNYLNADELRALNNLVEQYLVFAQSQAERRLPMNMQDWITKLEGFLILNDRGVLKNAGKVSADLAKACRRRIRSLSPYGRSIARIRLRPSRKKPPASTIGL